MCGCTPRDTPRHTPAVARLSVQLAAKDQGTKCTLSTVADSAGARPRKMVTVRMAKFDRFLLFSAVPGWQLSVNSRQWPKTAEIDQGSAGQSCGLPSPTNTVGLCWQQFKAALSCFTSRSKSPSTLPAPPKAALCLKNEDTPLTDCEKSHRISALCSEN